MTTENKRRSKIGIESGISGDYKAIKELATEKPNPKLRIISDAFTVSEITRDHFPDVILYDHDCKDGFTAMYCAYTAVSVVQQLVPSLKVEFARRPIKFVSWARGDGASHFAGKVMMIDTSIPVSACKDILNGSERVESIFILDHHISAYNDFIAAGLIEETAPPVNMITQDTSFYNTKPINAQFNLKKSGATLAYDWFIKPLIKVIMNTAAELNNSSKITGLGATYNKLRFDGLSKLCSYVEDWDLYTFKRKESRYYNAYASNLGLTIKNWMHLEEQIHLDSTKLQSLEIATTGKIIFETKLKAVKDLTRQVTTFAEEKYTLFFAVDIPRDHINLLAEYLLRNERIDSEVPAIVAIKNGDYWSFRSRSFIFNYPGKHGLFAFTANVSKLATKLGGGGHSCAAGVSRNSVQLEDVISAIKSTEDIFVKVTPPATTSFAIGISAYIKENENEDAETSKLTVFGSTVEHFNEAGVKITATTENLKKSKTKPARSVYPFADDEADDEDDEETEY